MKIGIISQARMTSTRLPGKVLKEVNGIPLLKYHADRVLQSGYPFYIATTINATDDPIVTFCKDENIPFYRGDENNVLSRYYECAKENKLDFIIRVTSDCPLIDGELIKEAMNQLDKDVDPHLYYSNVIERSFPRGHDFEFFSFLALEDAYQNATLEPDLEHVTPYINRNRSGKTIFKHFVNDIDKTAYRITVDTPSDFELIEQLIVNYRADHLNAQEIIAVLDQNPDLVQINSHIEQKKI